MQTPACALGIASTQAAGLKSQFGTMCKPLHAGHAATRVSLAARLAARGFTSRAEYSKPRKGSPRRRTWRVAERFDRALLDNSHLPGVYSNTTPPAT